MKKDVILALIIGFSIGALIAVLAVRLPVLLEKNRDTKTAKVSATVTPVISLTGRSVLEITTPQDGAILESIDLKIEGKAKAQSAVVIETALDSFIVESDKNGEFTGNLKLTEGSNQVYVSSQDANGDTETLNLNLFYTTEKI